MADAPADTVMAEAPPKEEEAEDGEILEDEEEEEEETGGDSDDDCDGIDASLPPAEKLLHYSYNAIKVVPTDFLGDFGAAEPFMIDGDALIAKALSDSLLDTTCGGQMLHVVWTVENILQDLRQRGAHFELFFFEGNLGLWHKMGARARAARAVVMRHFQCANKKREVQGMQPAVVINVLPGGWWSGGPEFRAMVDKVGPAYMMTDFGWCGAEDELVLAITRSFVHFLHANFVQVVTIADMSVEGSRTLANNMQPARNPATRRLFAQAMQKLVSDNKEALDAALPDTGSAGALGSGDIVDVTFVAALKKVVSDQAGGDKTGDLAAVLALATAMSKLIPLSERAFLIPDDALQAWKAAAPGWMSAAEAFMEAMNAAVACVLEDPSNAAALLASVTKDSNMRLADIVDGRLFLVILARCLAGGIKLSPELSAAAQKLFAGACPGDARVAGKKPAGASSGDEKASDELIKAILAQAQDRKSKETLSPVLLPLEGKDLLKTVQAELEGKMTKYENTAWDHGKHTLGKFRDRRYKDVEPFGDEPDPYSYKVQEDVIVMKKANKWNNAARQAQVAE